MGNRPGKPGRKKHVSKGAAAQGLTRKDMRRMLVIGGIVLGLALVVGLTLYLTRPGLVWFVDEDLVANWTRVLQANPPPDSRYSIRARSGDEPFPRGRFGFIITRNGPGGERVDGAPVALYRELARTQEYNGWLPLALDPWMVFRKHVDPEPGRSFLDNTNERGSLLFAGQDSGALNAWLCQLLQERPGIFVQGDEQWSEKGRRLVLDYPFQSGAFSYNWVQVWPLLFRSETSYIYAPLSQARALPSFRAGLLGATRFPNPLNWDRYGMQADVLWAQMQGGGKHQERLDAAEQWLKDAQTQTTIANIIDWIPAHPSGVPYNTVSWESQMAWLRSSYIWQGANDAQDS